MVPTAFITGINGQDGAYLARFLLEKGYRVIGGMRRTSSRKPWRLSELGILDKVTLVPFELGHLSLANRLMRDYRPDEVYNLAAQSSVHASFQQPIATAHADALGVVVLLEAIRKNQKHARFYQASSSEMFGLPRESPQSETTPFYSRSPYAAAKLYGHWITVNYREAYNLHASAGILFNHESPLRGLEYVTRKITASLAQIAGGQRKELFLGNVSVERDWGYAPDYVEGMYLMLQQDHGDDFVLATGESRSIEAFTATAAEALGIILEWEGEESKRIARDRASGAVIVRVSERLYRPTELYRSLGNASKATHELGWRRKVDFETLVELMVRSDVDRIRRGEPLRLLD